LLLFVVKSQMPPHRLPRLQLRAVSWQIQPSGTMAELLVPVTNGF